MSGSTERHPYISHIRSFGIQGNPDQYSQIPMLDDLSFPPAPQARVQLAETIHKPLHFLLGNALKKNPHSFTSQHFNIPFRISFHIVYRNSNMCYFSSCYHPFFPILLNFNPLPFKIRSTTTAIISTAPSTIN